MTALAVAIAAVQAHITACALTFNRDPLSISLLAVSKGQPASKIREAYHCGLTAFGENYLQEALPKQTQLTDLPIAWYYQGNIQTNKTRKIAEHFDWVLSVSSLNIAQRLNAQRPSTLPPLNICIQVDVSFEPTKSGVSIEAVEALCDAIKLLPRLCLRGLMAIPAPKINIEEQSQQYFSISALFDDLNRKGYKLDTLSLGMTQDLDAAIAKNSTMVRVGRAIFGERKK